MRSAGAAIIGKIAGWNSSTRPQRTRNLAPKIIQSNALDALEDEQEKSESPDPVPAWRFLGGIKPGPELDRLSKIEVEQALNAHWHVVESGGAGVARKKEHDWLGSGDPHRRCL